MARIAVVGAGLGGVPAAYDLRRTLGGEHDVHLIGKGETFDFTPSNPWIAVGWRKPGQISVPLAPSLARRGIEFHASGVDAIDAGASRLSLGNGDTLDYDYLVIATGPKLAFDEVEGLGPDAHSHSICTLGHSSRAHEAYEAFLEDPGPLVIGAVQGASCFGPAYEFAMTVDADLRKCKLRHRVPMTFVTSEPYIGHLGLGGVGDSKSLLESELRQRHIKWITNARVDAVHADRVVCTEHDPQGEPAKSHDVETRFTMMLPAFRGVDAVARVEDMCNPRGFVTIDRHQRNPKYANVFSAGVCVAIPPVEPTPVPTGAPKTGYMIESMVTAIAHNIEAELAGRPADATATWNAICLADLGDTGVAFVALPQIPPRNVTWARKGKWVHLAKIAFEKYFLRKVRSGDTDPVYERYVLKALGISRLEAHGT